MVKDKALYWRIESAKLTKTLIITKGDYLAKMPYDKVSTEDEAFKEAEKQVKERIGKLLRIKGSKTVDDFHKALVLS